MYPVKLLVGPIMLLVFTIDVEEEGLFSGKYNAENVTTRNIPKLMLLDGIFKRWNIKPTLLVTYPVVSEKEHHDFLLSKTQDWNGELGAHLHHWNTPPFVQLSYKSPVPSEYIEKNVLREKLNNLIDKISSNGSKVLSFRMGRFNIGPKMMSVLREAGIKTDSSVAPMRRYYGGPDHLSALVDPYFPDEMDILKPGNMDVLEVPLTILPLPKGVGKFLETETVESIIPGHSIEWFAQNLLSLPVQPFWTGLGRLKLGVRLHSHRGGEVLTVFLHSSELMAGGCPQHRYDSDVSKFLLKLEKFIEYLFTLYNIQSVTLHELYRQKTQKSGRL